MSDPVAAFDSHTVHQHEWIVLNAMPVHRDEMPTVYEMVLLCPHCERTKTFPTKPLYE